MGVFAFQSPLFMWGCAALAGGSLAAAVAFWAWPFWAELAARFLRMPAAGKAAFVAFVAVATAVAQKEEGTGSHAETKCTEEAKLRREHSPEANPQGAQACASRREGAAADLAAKSAKFAKAGERDARPYQICRDPPVVEADVLGRPR